MVPASLCLAVAAQLVSSLGGWSVASERRTPELYLTCCSPSCLAIRCAELVLINIVTAPSTQVIEFEMLR
jgi:hypothetical protein